MTGSSYKRYSDLRDGEVDRWKARLTQLGFGANHVRDFLEDDAELCEWIKDGIARIERLWRDHSSYIPNAKTWQRVANTDFMIKLAEKPFVSMESRHDTLAIVIGRGSESDESMTRTTIVHLAHHAWNEVLPGVEMRRWGTNGVEVRLLDARGEPAQRRRNWQTALRHGIRHTIETGIEATLPDPNKPHKCYLCSGKESLIVKLYIAHRDRSDEDVAWVHLYGEEWHKIGQDISIRTLSSEHGVVEVCRTQAVVR